METFEFTSVSRTILSDMHTPVGVYMRLRDLYPTSMLLESSDYNDPANSRSFIGLNPMGSVAIGHGISTVTFPDGSVAVHNIGKGFDESDSIHEFTQRVKVKGEDSSVYGLFGYTSFNIVRYLEQIQIKDVTMEKDEENMRRRQMILGKMVKLQEKLEK